MKEKFGSLQNPPPLTDPTAIFYNNTRLALGLATPSSAPTGNIDHFVEICFYLGWNWGLYTSLSPAVQKAVSSSLWSSVYGIMMNYNSTTFKTITPSDLTAFQGYLNAMMAATANTN